MEKFDIEKIGKGMPYAKPSADFFEQFTHETLARAEAESRRRVWLRGALLSAASVAAAVVAFFVVDSFDGGVSNMYASYDNDLDAYVATLSDDELSTLFYDMEVEGAFYSNM